MRILVVEDELRLLKNLAKILGEDGYEVDTADNGEDGLTRAEIHEYAAIVLDVMLPGMNGWEVLNLLRRTKATPVLMLTATDKSHASDLDHAYGAIDHLSKPFDLVDLRARLRTLTHR